MNDMHEANRRRWNAASPSYAAMAERSGSWRKAAENPAWAFLPQELALLGDVRGKRACVLGSGDNLAVFALAGRGAEVTSVDISERQLEVARTRAEALGLAVRFVRADVTQLDDLHDGEFELVHTGRHVAVWVTELHRYSREAVRVLVPGGLFLVTEYHPFRRIFAYTRDALRVAHGYLARGPFRHDAPDGLFDPGPGPHPQYESHWTVADFYNAIVETGCDVIAFDELGDEAEGWEVPPLAGLPQLLLIAARKR